MVILDVSRVSLLRMHEAMVRLGCRSATEMVFDCIGYVLCCDERAILDLNGLDLRKGACSITKAGFMNRSLGG